MTGRYYLVSSPAKVALRFQSSPGLVTGRYHSKRQCHANNSWFQSSPGLVTGRYLAFGGATTDGRRFNPRPVW